MSVKNDLPDLAPLIHQAALDPLLLKLYYQQKITLETLVIINKLLSFAHQWDEQLNHDVLWNDTQRRMLKYEPFLKINKKQFKSLMKETFKC